jgi:hypothetical protein
MSHPRPISTCLKLALAGLALAAATQAMSARSDDGYALVRDGKSGISISGSATDSADLKRMRKQLGGEFLWFRDGGKGYVIQDAATLARVRAAWEPVERLGEQMNVYGQEMNRHGQAMNALGAEMSKAGQGMQPDQAKLASIQRRMGEVGREMGEVGAAMARADDAEQQRLQNRMIELQRDMNQLDREMAAAAQSDSQRKAEHAMHEVGLRMDAANKPMEALGKKMDVLGKQMDQESTRADKTVREVIRDAMAKGLARPAPQG